MSDTEIQLINAIEVLSKIPEKYARNQDYKTQKANAKRLRINRLSNKKYPKESWKISFLRDLYWLNILEGNEVSHERKELALFYIQKIQGFEIDCSALDFQSLSYFLDSLRDIACLKLKQDYCKSKSAAMIHFMIQSTMLLYYFVIANSKECFLNFSKSNNSTQSKFSQINLKYLYKTYSKNATFKLANSNMP